MLARNYSADKTIQDNHEIDTFLILTDNASVIEVSDYRLEVKTKNCQNVCMLEMKFIVARLVEESGLSVYDIADALGVHNTAVYMWLNGKRKPKIETLSKLAKLAGYTVFAIYRGDEEYITITKKDASDMSAIIEDITAISSRLDDKRLDLLRNIAIAAPDLTDQTIDLLNRFMGDNMGVPVRDSGKTA